MGAVPSALVSGVGAYTPTLTQAGATWNTISGWWKRTPGMLWVWGNALLSTAAAAQLTISLPFAVTVDGLTAVPLVGFMANGGNVGTSWTYLCSNGDGTNIKAQNASWTGLNATTYGWSAHIPIAG